MPNFVRIKRKAYNKSAALLLCSKAANIVAKCEAKEVYLPFKHLYDDVKAKVAVYKPLVDSGKYAGKSVTSARKTAKPALIIAIDLLADAIDKSPNVTAQFIVEAGFETYKTPTSHESNIQAPTKVSVMSTGVTTEVTVRFKVPDRTQVYINVIWLSFDDGATWNDYYTKKSVLTITGLNPGDKVLVKVRTVGTNNRKSPWANGANPAYVN